MKYSLHTKTILLIAAIGLLISAVSIAVFYNGLHNEIIAQYSNQSIDIANLVATQIDTEKVENVRNAVEKIYVNSDPKVYSDMWGTPEFEEYISQFSQIEEMEDFQSVREQLQKMQDSINVDCLYITFSDLPNKTYIYLIDAAHEDPCPPGVLDRFFDETNKGLYDLEVGFEPNISKTEEYGWLITTGMPIHNKEGKVIATSAVDISMNEIMKQQNRFLMISVGILLLLTVLVSLFGISLVNRFIVTPINKLSVAAGKYHADQQNFNDLNIRTGDEIETLSESMKQMEQDIHSYVDSLIAARRHADQMEEAANIDAMTKVRNKRAYDIRIAQLDQYNPVYGIVLADLNNLKLINDTYGHDKGDLAILSLCKTICNIFKHSSVYRIGGDEFTVILENTDYQDREELLEKMEHSMQLLQENENLPAWERISAAVGYAIYDPQKDKNAEDVFKRADAAMYQRKREMKH